MGELSLRRMGGSAKVAKGSFTPSSYEQTHTVSGLDFRPDHFIVYRPGYSNNSGFIFTGDFFAYVFYYGSGIQTQMRAGQINSDGFTTGSAGSTSASWFQSGYTFNWVAWKE